MLLPEWLSISHFEKAKNLHKNNYKITRNFVKKRVAYYRKHRKIFCNSDLCPVISHDYYISDFDIYFKPKKFFNSHWVKKEIKELNIRQEIKQ